MTAAQSAKFLKQLLQLERELSGKGPHKIEGNADVAGVVGGAEDEQPLNEMLQSIASSRNRNLEGMLVRVRKALAKLRERPDDFGECEECDEEIAPKRLEAMPYAELCVACQSKRDPSKGGPTRKKLTDYR